MDTFERVELRRFVGREFLLWLWFETEVLDATLSTKAHGAFGLWLEGRLVLSAGKETTTIKGTTPGLPREAKESLLLGKMPELAALHLTWNNGKDATFTLKAETLALGGLKLPRDEPDDAQVASHEGIAELGAAIHKKPRKSAETFAADEAHEDFYERMAITREIETIIEALYRDFLTLRLGAAWETFVLGALGTWSHGQPVDSEAYALARKRALHGPKA